MTPISHPSGIVEFRAQLIQDIYSHLYQMVDDNFDFIRYNHDGIDRSEKLDIKGNAAYLDFVLRNIESFFAASLLFSDSASRELFLQLIKYRCLGHPHLRIREDMTWSRIQAMFAQAESYETGPSVLPFAGMFGPLKHHENLPSEERPLELDAWTGNVAYGLGYAGHRQYYFNRNGLRIQPEAGDWVIDGGACFGDTAVFFAMSAGPEGRVFAFEPLPEHINVMAHNIDQNALEDRVFIVPNGLGELTNQVTNISALLSGIANPGFSVASVEDAVPILALDDFLSLQGIDRTDFIKLDVEGFELKALKGAAATLGRHRPRLAISLYHKPEDFFEIPLYLKTHFPFYRLYLDHYTIARDETVLYALADPFP